MRCAGADAAAPQASELNSAILAKQGQRETPRLPGVFRLLAWAQDKVGKKVGGPKWELPDGWQGDGGLGKE